MVKTSGNAAGLLSTPAVMAQSLAALRAFVVALLPTGTPVLRGQQNHVPAPVGLFALLTPLGRQPLASTASTTTATTLSFTAAEALSVQLSLFGPGAAEAAQSIAIMFKTEWACQFFTTLAQQATTTPTTQTITEPPPLTPARLAPLYATAPHQALFINSENQFEEHWLLELHSQINTTLSVPQSTARAASLALCPTLSLKDTPA